MDNKKLENLYLASLILNEKENKSLITGITEKHFYDKFNKLVFQSVKKIIQKEASTFDIELLKSMVRKNDILTEEESDAALTNIIVNDINFENSFFYKKELVRETNKRKIKKTAQKILLEINKDDVNIEELLDKFSKESFVLEEEIPFDIKELIKLKKEIMNSEFVKPISTGLPMLDDKLQGGFQKGDLIVLAGRPAMGKTAFALNLLLSIAKENKKTLFFSLEMSAMQLFDRLFAIHTQIKHSLIQNANINHKDSIVDVKELEKRLNDFKNYKVIIEEKKNTLEDIISLASVVKPDIVFIDYLQLIRNNSKAGTREQEVSNISRQLKMLAKKINAPVVVLSQLSRGVESRLDKRPFLSDLRESGAIEQDADTVIFLYRESYYRNELIQEGEFCTNEILIRKQRRGQNATVLSYFNLSTQLFVDESYYDFKNIKKNTDNFDVYEKVEEMTKTIEEKEKIDFDNKYEVVENNKEIEIDLDFFREKF